MLYVLLGLYIFIIFPIYSKFNFAFILNNRKLYFTINILGLSIIGGYVTVKKNGFIILIGKSKVIKYPYKKLLRIKNNTKILKDFNIMSFRSFVEYGNENSVCFANAIANVYVWHNNVLGKIFSYIKPYLKLQNDVNLYQDCNKLNVYLEIKILFNILSILIILTKIIKEKICNAIKR